MSDPGQRERRVYDLEAVVAAHRAASAGTWVRLSDAQYDAIAGTVLRGAAAEELPTCDRCGGGIVNPGRHGEGWCIEL